MDDYSKFESRNDFAILVFSIGYMEKYRPILYLIKSSLQEFKRVYDFVI